MDPQPASGEKSQYNQIVERLRSANNVLVTVSKNPTVDQLAACIGLSLALNKLGKHASAVFSGQIPSTIDFLQPEKTIEKTTDSLRDFIISLDKSKADKLRYKVEDEMVKIFITPYKSSISEEDLEFTQGDFNIDAIVALGVHDRVQLDQAILAHGRILHDAVLMSLNTQGGSQLGSLAWVEPNASSLCEMVGDIANELSPTVFDGQISTALLTGIVAETNRFSNQKASPHTMSVAGILMGAGASTQLVTTKLEEPTSVQQDGQITDESKQPDGFLAIEHVEEDTSVSPPDEPQKTLDTEEIQFQDPLASPELETPPLPPEGEEKPPQRPEPTNETPSTRAYNDPPQRTAPLTANTVPEDDQYIATTDPLLEPSPVETPDAILQAKKTIEPLDPTDSSTKTIEEIEESVDSPHLRKEKQPADKDSQPTEMPMQALTYEETGNSVAENTRTDGQPRAREDETSSTPPPPQVPPPMMPPEE